MEKAFKNTCSTAYSAKFSKQAPSQCWKSRIDPNVDADYHRLTFNSSFRDRKTQRESKKFANTVRDSRGFNSPIKFFPYQTMNPSPTRKSECDQTFSQRNSFRSSENEKVKSFQKKQSHKKNISSYENQIKQQERQYLRNVLIQHFEQMNGKKCCNSCS